MYTRTIVVALAIAIWCLVGFLWLLPRKLRLLKKYGYDKTAWDILAHKKEDADLRKLLRDTWIWLPIGIVGGLIIVFTK